MRIADTASAKAVHAAFNGIASSMGGLELRAGPPIKDKWLNDKQDAILLQYTFPDPTKAAQFKETMKALNNMWYSTGKFLIINNEIVSVK